MAGGKSSFADYQRIVTALQAGKLQSLYFAKGNDYYLQKGFMAALRSAFKTIHGSNGELIQRWGADLKSASDVSTLLGGGSLFSSSSLILLNEIQDAGIGVKTKLTDLLTQLPPATTVCVSYSVEDQRKAKWLDAMQRMGEFVPLGRPDVTRLPSIIQDMAQKWDLTVDQAAIFRLIELTSGELAIIDNELEKITLFLDENQHLVTAEVVDGVAGSIENAHVFQFIEAVSRRDSRQAMQTMVEIHHQGKEGLPYVVTLLYGRLIQLMALQETPEARKTINREGTSDYFLRSMGPYSKNYSMSELQRATRQLAELDIAFRLGSVDLLTSFSAWISKVV